MCGTRHHNMLVNHGFANERQELTITVKFFASLREKMGCSEKRVEDVAGKTVAELWASVSGGEPLPQNIRAAVNLEYVEMTEPVADGDEVAFVPPVTGG